MIHIIPNYFAVRALDLPKEKTLLKHIKQMAGKPTVIVTRLFEKTPFTVAAIAGRLQETTKALSKKDVEQIVARDGATSFYLHSAAALAYELEKNGARVEHESIVKARGTSVRDYARYQDETAREIARRLKKRDDAFVIVMTDLWPSVTKALLDEGHDVTVHRDRGINMLTRQEHTRMTKVVGQEMASSFLRNLLENAERAEIDRCKLTQWASQRGAYPVVLN